MGHAVVHLAGDPRPFHRRGQGTVLVPFTLHPLGPVAQLGEVGPPGAHVQAHDENPGRESGRVRGGQRPVPGAIVADHGEHDAGHQHRRGERFRPSHRGGHRVQGDGQRDREQCPVGRPHGQDRRGQDRPGEHRARPDAAQRQGQRGQGRDAQAGRQRQRGGVGRLAEREVRQGRREGEQGAANVEGPGTQGPRSRVLDRLPEGHPCILAPGAVHASRRRSCQAARPASTTAYPQSTANPAHGPSGWAASGWPHRAPPALDGR